MEKKQTAVQWLEGQLNIWQTIADEDTNATLDVVRGWIAKLKEMEKEQMLEFGSKVTERWGMCKVEQNFIEDEFDKFYKSE